MTKKQLNNSARIIFCLFVINFAFLGPFCAKLAIGETKYVLIAPDVLTGYQTPLGTGDVKPEITLKEYLGYAYKTFFVVVLVSAVMMFVFGGFQYILTDIVTSKQKGKDRITKALYGLGLALISYLVLRLINPNLVEFKIITNALGDVPNTNN